MNNWIKKDLKYIWHPFTQMKDCCKLPPILIEKAKGIKLYDIKGNIYYDTISSWWCNVFGHNHPKVTSAIREQIKKLDHVLFAGFTHKPAIMLAQKLTSITPKNLKKVFFSDNGSTAVEVALKMSFQYWKNIGVKTKRSFVSLDYAYHGDTIGAMSVSGVSLFNEVFKPLFFKSFKAPSPYCYRCPMKKELKSCQLDCIKPLEKLLEKRNFEIAAIILEPLVLAAGGMIIYPKEYLKKVAQLAKVYGVHLILDEVATGFGRTGKMFACEYAEVEPDFMCLAKGITSGILPLAVTLTTDKIYKAFYDDYYKKKTFYHGHTYTANPIACAAALATLKIFEEEKILENLKPKIDLLATKLKEFNNLDIVGDVRTMGLIGAIELVKNKNKKIPFSFKERIGFKIYREALKKGLILRPLSNVIYFFLPLSISKNQLEYILFTTYKLIKEIKNNF
ncbi:MAG: adenosylmethionine--8-amino-7-oxononanoate transaminase [Candidatus Omnitrophica bacterium]|nr:adenosylmethionine--8-amino-7-oxononanoate transaminase [Candidatus Omnitrophota bacterium]